MNYQRVYDQFVEDRLRRQHAVYEGDVHHIVPRCVGGTNDTLNLVKLTYSDHLFAHVLLAKIHGGVLAQSAIRMAGMRKYNGGRSLRNRYAGLRRAAVEAARKRVKLGWNDPGSAYHGDQYKSLQREAHTGNTHAAGGRGKTKSEAHKAKIRSRLRTPEAREAARLRSVERGISPELRSKMTQGLRRRYRS